MATKSFLKSVNISGKKNILRFVNALDRHNNTHDIKENDNPVYYEVKKDNLDKLLAGYANREVN